MYPKNNASPPPVAVGSIYLIADGTIQTSGASVRVKTEGGSWAAGGNSPEYDATSGAITYTPTQAETNGAWFIVCVYKASCTSATREVITTASSTAGQVVTDTASRNASKADVSSLSTADKMLAYFQLVTRNDAAIATDRSTELAEINNDEGSGAGDFDNTTDSLEAAEPAEIFAAVLTTQLTEAYAADGTAPTLEQAIFLIQQSLHEFGISGTTRTVRKLDGTTPAATFTLDSATAPTDTTRAT